MGDAKAAHDAVDKIAAISDQTVVVTGNAATSGQECFTNPIIVGAALALFPNDHDLVPAAKGSDELAEGRVLVAGKCSIALRFEAALAKNWHIGDWHVSPVSELEAEQTSLSL